MTPRIPWALAFLAFFATFIRHGNAGDRPPNFVIILCDNLGYGDIQPFGSQVHRTPNLNRMAIEGRRFTHFYSSAGVCTPSRASLLTGCYAQRLGMHTNPRDGQVLRPISPYGLHPDETTIAEVLEPLGYATAAIGKWHLGDQADFLPTKQGFDSFYGIPYSDDMTLDVGRRLGKRFQGDQWPPLPLMRNEVVIEAPTDRNLLTKRCTSEALKFIDEHRDEPFLLYFAQPMPGSTSAPFASPEFKEQSLNGPWGDAIEEIDWSTGQILDRLVELQLDESTLVVWTSDNGAPLARDLASPERGSNAPLHGRGYTTSEGGFRVPTLMWWPSKIPPSTTCDELCTMMDLLPTCFHLAGEDKRLPAQVDGFDISPLVFGDDSAKTPYEAFYYYASDQLQAVRSGPWKLFVPLKQFGRHPHFRQGESSRPMLFNLVTDQGSTKDVSAENPGVVSRLMELAEQGRQDLGDQGVVGKGQRLRGQVDGPLPLRLQR